MPINKVLLYKSKNITLSKIITSRRLLGSSTPSARTSYQLWLNRLTCACRDRRTASAWRAASAECGWRPSWPRVPWCASAVSGSVRWARRPSRIYWKGFLSKSLAKPGWSSGYGRRLVFQRSSVRIPALYTLWTFFTFIFCKNCNVCLKKTIIKEKEAEDDPFF